jgi:hypothetical protein
MKMESTYFLRQLDIADPAKFKDKPVTVIGAGGIDAVNHKPQIPIADAVARRPARMAQRRSS